MKKRGVSLITVLSMLISLVPVLFAAPVQAAASINIGDYIQMGTYYGEPILWRCVDKDENGPLMLSDKIICLKPYDARGEANTTTGSHSRASNRQSGGSNYWADSNMRSWLNSNASAGNVTWLCGNPPDEDHVWNGYNEYDQEAGFLTNFSQSELNAIKEVTQKSIVAYPEYENGVYTTGTEAHELYYSISSVVANYDSAYAEYVTDKMFLLDVKQVNAVYNNGDVLGSDYYIGEITEEACNNSESSVSYSNGKKWYYWLRSPYAYLNYPVRSVYSDGGVNDSDADNYGVGVRPAFYLNLSSAIFKSGSGTEGSPYTVEGSGSGDSGGDDSGGGLSNSTSEGAPIIKSAALTYNSHTYDIFSEAVTIEEGSDIIASIEATVDKNGCENVKVYVTQGVGGEIDITDVCIDITPGEVFSEGKTIYILAVDENTGKSTSKATKLKVSSLISGSIGADSGVEGLNFTLGKKVGFTVPDSFPVLGGYEVGWSFDFIPVSVEYDREDDNKVNVVFGTTLVTEEYEKNGVKRKYFSDFDFKEYKKAFSHAKRTQKHSLSDLRKFFDKGTKPDFSFFKGVIAGSGEGGSSGDISVAGYAEMKYLDGSWQLAEGELALNVEVEYKYQGQIFIWVVPLYYEFGGGVGAGVEGKMIDIDTKKFSPKIEGYLTGKIMAEIGGGVGIAKVATAGASGEASLNIKTGILRDYIKVWGEGSASFNVKVFGKVVAEKEFARGDFLIYETGNSNGLIKDKNAMTLESADDVYDAIDINVIYENEDRAYAENPTSWLGSDEKLSLTSTDYTNKNLKKLADNIYTECAPQMCDIDGTKVMVMQWDNTGRADADRTMLVYSVYDDTMGTWSEPSVVYDDGTADFYPCFRDGYLVWQNEKTELADDMTLADIAALGEIYAAKWNGSGFDEPVRITDNTVLDTIPQVAASGSGASVVWTTNTENDILGTSGSNSIMRSDFDGTKWSAPEVIEPGLNAVVNLSAGTVDGTFAAAYVPDEDNDLSTIDDRDIYIISDGAEKQLTDNDVLDSNPVFANNMIYYYSDGNIVYSDIDGANMQTVFDEEISGLTDNFVVDGNAGGDTAIWWTKADEGSTEVYSSLYKDGEWSGEVQVTSIGNKAKYPCGLINDDGSMLVAFNNAVLENDKITKTDLYTISVNPSYDLKITDAYTDEENSKAYITVKNSGELTINSYDIVTDYGDVTSVTTPLKAGETTELEITYNPSKALSAKSITFTVQLTDGEEYDTDNNSVSLDVCSADVVVENVAANEDETAVAADVSNTGLTDAEYVTVSLREGTADGTVIDSRVLTLAVGGSETVEFAIDKTQMRFMSGQKQLYITAEYDKSETSLGNNDGYTYITSPSGWADYQNDILDCCEVDGESIVNSVAVNNTSSSVTCMIYTAVYTSDGRLKACDLKKNVTIGADDSIGVDAAVGCEIDETDVVKTMMWNADGESLALSSQNGEFTGASPETTPTPVPSIKVGSYVQMGTYYGEPILWRCVDIDENGPLMLSDKIICLKSFDAKGTATTGSHSRDSDRQLYGSNYWADSNIRAWLNSSARAGNVTWACGSAPNESNVWRKYNEYDKEAGFLTNFSQGELNAMKSVTQKAVVSYPEFNNGIYSSGTKAHELNASISDVLENYDDAYAEYVTDKVFLMDVKQANAVYNNGSVLGKDYYIGEPTEQCIAGSEYTTDDLAAGNKWSAWLRTPSTYNYRYYNSSSYVRRIDSDGAVDDDNAYYGSVGVRPAFYLNTESAVLKSGSGMESNPYIVGE